MYLNAHKYLLEITSQSLKLIVEEIRRSSENLLGGVFMEEWPINSFQVSIPKHL